MLVCWFSGGITSAVAASFVPDAELIYMETGSHHPDMPRFLADCEKWLGRKITILRNDKYDSHFDVCEKRRFLNSPNGALCTFELKRKMRMLWEKDKTDLIYVWGYDCDEVDRVTGIIESVKNAAHKCPLLERGISKRDCIEILRKAGIELPAMYRLGYHNNNCIGCVKGGMSYWNHIRKDFPEVFERMAKLERTLGRSCMKKYFLDELPLDAGRGKPPLVHDCGSVGDGCEIQQSIFYFGRE